VNHKPTALGSVAEAGTALSAASQRAQADEFASCSVADAKNVREKSTWPAMTGIVTVGNRLSTEGT
jgi:hypothetical protein